LEKAALGEVMLAVAVAQGEFTETAPLNQENILPSAGSSSITLHSQNLIFC
jgi:hypothetical protein